jgi:hypothetical protein
MLEKIEKNTVWWKKSHIIKAWHCVSIIPSILVRGWGFAWVWLEHSGQRSQWWTHYVLHLQLHLQGALGVFKHGMLACWLGFWNVKWAWGDKVGLPAAKRVYLGLTTITFLNNSALFLKVNLHSLNGGSTKTTTFLE